jgi:hypothetical protein
MDLHIQQYIDTVWDEESFKDNKSTFGRMKGGIYGWQREPGSDRRENNYWDSHRCGFNAKALTFFLQRSGFVKIRTKVSECGYHLVAFANKPKHPNKVVPRNPKKVAIEAPKEKAPHPNYVWTSPYGSSWPATCLGYAGVHQYRKSKVNKEKDFINIINSGDIPDLLILGNFIVDRHVIRERALAAGMDVIHGEDGFIPHYSTLHVDPLGFCWESSLTKMLYRGELDISHRRVAENLIKTHIQAVHRVEPRFKKPYVLYPLQLIGDRVNQFGLNETKSWLKYVMHARKVIPDDYDMVIKTHPRGANVKDIEEWAQKQQNVTLFRERMNIHEIIKDASAVIGVNSTVLTEARLLFNKPVWAMGDSWYTNHTRLIYRIDTRFPPRDLPNEDHLYNGIPTDDEDLDTYRLWYIGQLMARQYTQKMKSDKERYKKWLYARTYKSWLKYGEEIFKVDGILK